MGLFDYTRIYGDEVRTLLDDGERLRFVSTFQLAIGDKDDLGVPLRERSTKAITGFDPLWGIEWNRRVHTRIGRLMAPMVAAGGPASVAARIIEVVEIRGGLFLVVTDHRLLILERDLRRRGWSVLFELPRADIVDTRRAGQLLLVPQRGRVLFTFADGSQLAVLTAMFTTGTARALVHALTA